MTCRCRAGYRRRCAPRGQRTVTRAPPCGRLRTCSRPPVCSIRVLAMKKPSPMPCWPREGVRGAQFGLAQRIDARPRGDIGLADPLQDLRREARPVILDRDREAAAHPTGRGYRCALRRNRRHWRSDCPGRAAVRAPARPWARARRPRPAPAGSAISRSSLRYGPARSSSNAPSGRRWVASSTLCSGRASGVRMARQRSACSRSSLASSACGESGGNSRSSSRATTAMVPSGVPSSWAAAVASAPIEAMRCSRASASWVAAKPGRHARRFAGDAPGIDRGEADADHERSPDAALIERRQEQRLVRRPGQGLVHRSRSATPRQRPGPPGSACCRD